MAARLEVMESRPASLFVLKLCTCSESLRSTSDYPGVGWCMMANVFLVASGRKPATFRRRHENIEINRPGSSKILDRGMFLNSE